MTDDQEAFENLGLELRQAIAEIGMSRQAAHFHVAVHLIGMAGAILSLIPDADDERLRATSQLSAYLYERAGIQAH